MLPEGKGVRVRASEKVPGAPLEKSGALLLGRGSQGASAASPGGSGPRLLLPVGTWQGEQV